MGAARRLGRAAGAAGRREVGARRECRGKPASVGRLRGVMGWVKATQKAK